MIFPPFLSSSKNSRENSSSQHLLSGTKKVLISSWISRTRKIEGNSIKRENWDGKTKQKIWLLWFRYHLEFGSCQLKAKYKERKKGRKKERKKEQKLERERKKERKKEWLGLGFPEISENNPSRTMFPSQKLGGKKLELSYPFPKTRMVLNLDCHTVLLSFRAVVRFAPTYKIISTSHKKVRKKCHVLFECPLINLTYVIQQCICWSQLKYNQQRVTF